MNKPDQSIIVHPKQQPVAAAGALEQPSSSKQPYEAYCLSHKTQRYLPLREEESKPRALILEIPNSKAPYRAFYAPEGEPQTRLIIYAQQMFQMPHYGGGAGYSLLRPL